MVIKNVVKVMNFHSLLRVDKSQRRAHMYFETEEELLKIIRKVGLNIYIGNDLGFCGDFNFSINKEVRRDQDYKIIIGKKIHSFNSDRTLLEMSKEDFFQHFKPVEDLIYDAIVGRKYREIYVIYNHYYNVNRLEFMKKKLFPFDYYSDEDPDSYSEDFAMETDLTPMLNNLIALYICYELKICEMNSYAAENVIRQQITRESLKKIDELEEEKLQVERKMKKQRDFQRIIENYRKG